MEDELPGVLDGVDEPVTVEELEAVVRRAAQRRRARLAAGAAGMLALGALGGALAGGTGDRTTGFSATDAPEPRATATATTLPSGAWGGMGGVPLVPLFRREANGVAIRAYRTTWTTDPAAQANCAPPDVVQGELSNSAAVGVAMVPLVEGDSFALLGTGHFGTEEGEPATWATVRSGAGVSTVRLQLAGATDSMAPEKGLAVVAVPGRTGEGVVEGLDAGGKVVATASLSRPIEVSAPNPSCNPPPCTVGGGPGSPTLPPPPPVATTVPGDGASGAPLVPPVTGLSPLVPGPGHGVEAVPCPGPGPAVTLPVPPPASGSPGTGTVVTAPPVTPPPAAATTTIAAEPAGPATTTPAATTVATPTTSGAAP